MELFSSEENFGLATCRVPCRPPAETKVTKQCLDPLKPIADMSSSTA